MVFLKRKDKTDSERELEKIYANLKDLIKFERYLENSKYFKKDDLIVKSPELDGIWIRVAGNSREAIQNLEDIMNHEKRFIRYMVEKPISRKIKIFKEEKIIPEEDGLIEVEATSNIISIKEYNKLGGQVGCVMMNWESYEQLKEYLDKIKQKYAIEEGEGYNSSI